MSDAIKFQCDLSTTDPTIPLGIEILCNGTSVFKLDHVTGPCQVSFDVGDDEETATQKLQFIMSGKTTEHTKVDEQGTIISDAMLTINNIVIDNIDISLLLTDNSEYSHNFNGTQVAITEKFHGNMGCNGTVTFEFTTPFYLWLLERM
jgi:hypothetical protein